MTNQEIYNRFFFLEGLVNESTFKRIAEEAIKIHNESSKASYGGILHEAALWLHAAYDRPPQSPDCVAMLSRIDALLQENIN